VASPPSNKYEYKKKDKQSIFFKTPHAQLNGACDNYRVKVPQHSGCQCHMEQKTRFMKPRSRGDGQMWLLTHSDRTGLRLCREESEKSLQEV
jgi:hypothetical protein